MKTKMFQFAVLLGIIEPILYFVLITTLSLLKHDYHSTKQYISELSGSGEPHHQITSFGSFVLLGMSVILTGHALRTHFRNTSVTTAPYALMTITGCSLILLGLLPADTKTSGTTITGKLHRLITFPAGVAMPAAMLLYARIFAHEKRWKKTWPLFSAALAWTTIISGWAVLTQKQSRHIGLIQRVAMGPPLLWLAAVSNKLRTTALHY